MKILHIIGGGDIGGAKSHVLSLIKELSKHIDVKLISLRPGLFSDDAKAMGIDVEVIKSGNIISDLKKVKRLLQNEDIKLLHSHGSKANLFSALLKRGTDIKTVTTVHSDYRLDYLQSITKRFSFGIINTLALRYIDYYIAVSNNFKMMLIERNFSEERIFSVYNGIDFTKEVINYKKEDFISKYKLSVNENDILIGILARFDPVKGLDIFIKSAKLVTDKYPNVKFVLGGDGKQRKSLEELICSLELRDKVLFAGWVDNPYEFMCSMDINVLTSLSESFPYVILEGVLYRKPTVSSDVGGISDLIETGENGFLFTPGNYKKLAEHLSTLVSDSELRKSMGEKIHAKASKEFSLDNMYKTHLDIYSKILKG